MAKIFMIIGSLNALVSVALGAFGAHGLKERISSEMLDVFKTGVQYHMVHALGILLIALFTEKLGTSSLAQWSGWIMFVGIMLFSGSLYILSTTGLKALGAITPLGGLCFLIAWMLLAVAAFKSSN